MVQEFFKSCNLVENGFWRIGFCIFYFKNVGLKMIKNVQLVYSFYLMSFKEIYKYKLCV